MRKALPWVLGTLLATLCITGILLAICVSSFVQPGIRVLGRYAHLELQKNCYFITSNSIDGQKITGQSRFTAQGYLQDAPGDASGAFKGHMSVEQYPVSFEEGFRWHWGNIENDKIMLSCQGGPLDTYYVIYILRNDPDVIVIHIFSKDGNRTAVCGDNEEDAISNYAKYIEQFP